MTTIISQKPLSLLGVVFLAPHTKQMLVLKKLSPYFISK
jgi:hypothetical protein